MRCWHREPDAESIAGNPAVQAIGNALCGPEADSIRADAWLNRRRGMGIIDQALLVWPQSGLRRCLAARVHPGFLVSSWPRPGKSA